MIFEEIRIMRGPNMWSQNHHNLLAVKFIADQYAHLTDNDYLKIKKFFIDNYGIVPLHDQKSLSVFRMTLQLAAKLQSDSFFHDIVTPSKDILYGIVEYKIEEAGLKALKLASNIVESILKNVQPVDFKFAKEQVNTEQLKYSEGPSTSMIIEAAKTRNIPVNKGPAGYTILGQGKYQKRISAALSHNTTCIGVNIAGNKEATKKFLQNSYLPVPDGLITSDENDLMSISKKLDYPLVTKPLNGNQGKNVTCNITNFESLLTGFRSAHELSKSVIIEKEIQGNDFRLLVVGNRFVAASLRLPASVTGNGVLSVKELVDFENKNPNRGEGHESILTKIKCDAATELCLQRQGLSLFSVPEIGKQIFLKLTANLSTGGTAVDVTEDVHPENIKIAEKASKILGLDICGIDIITSDISQPISKNGGAIIEINAAPGLRMHKFPSKGKSREVGKPIVDVMFSGNEDGRIPIVAITGTNGKTTTTRLMAQIAHYANYNVGFSSTDGIYVGGDKIHSGDCSGPQSARTILQDPTVDFAVLECARGGIIRSGLGFDQCDIGIVTNVAADHIGLKDIHTLEDLALVKSVVPASVKKGGWAILNATDNLAFNMKNNLSCNVAVFSSDHNNINLIQHLDTGGLAIYCDEKKDIYISQNGKINFLFNATDIPITRNGKAGFMIDNLLPVVLGAHLLNFKNEDIYSALKTFLPSAENTPGRINEFEINGVNVIVDYAHNPHGLKALAGYIKNIPNRKLGIITGTGDRREEDIIEFGKIAAGMFDDIIIRFDRDLRGRTMDAILELLQKGFDQNKPVLKFEIITETGAAIHHAISTVQKGSYVIVCADNATYTLGLVNKIQQQFQNNSEI